MAKWLAAALDYVPRWLDYQLLQTGQPGYAIAVTRNGALVFDHAHGSANLTTREKLTPHHRFRVASHSKTFTAAGIMRLREAGLLSLDDAVGKHVSSLSAPVAKVTVAQLLSHSAGILRDGVDADHWADRKPFSHEAELRDGLKQRQPIPANTRFKYSNYGYGLLGLVIEAVTGERYAGWMAREVVAAAGLKATLPDYPDGAKLRMASGHSARLPLGHRIAIAGMNPTHALAAATGFVSTASDLVRFFSQLDPNAPRSFLDVASRREMSRRQWRSPHSEWERYYGLGTMSGTDDGWPWFGHGGAFQGFITRTSVLPEQRVAVSVLTNAIDGLANQWMDGIVHIFQRFASHGAPVRSVAGWTGRWWSLWNASDFVPMGRRVAIANPALLKPFTDAPEIEVSGNDSGRIVLANGFGSHGEGVRRIRKGSGVAEIRLAASRLLPEKQIVAELRRREAKGRKR